VHRIVEVCYFEIYAKRLKLVIHTDARAKHIVERQRDKMCEPEEVLRPKAHSP
jgi:hypothetical protein